jgi:hypothetical protein
MTTKSVQTSTHPQDIASAGGNGQPSTHKRFWKIKSSISRICLPHCSSCRRAFETGHHIALCKEFWISHRYTDLATALHNPYTGFQEECSHSALGKIQSEHDPGRARTNDADIVAVRLDRHAFFKVEDQVQFPAWQERRQRTRCVKDSRTRWPLTKCGIYSDTGTILLLQIPHFRNGVLVYF